MDRHAARAPLWVLVMLTLAVGVWTLDEVVFAKTIEFAWTEPNELGESISEDVLARRLAGTHKLRLIVRGRATPLRFFDLDNVFGISLTRGGYQIGTNYDLLNGRDDYAAYLAKCRVSWESDRVRFIEPRGYEFVFPASEFHLMD